MECSELIDLRNNLLSQLNNIIPSFDKKTVLDKLKFIFSTNDYDIMKICIEGINKMCVKRKQFK